MSMRRNRLWIGIYSNMNKFKICIGGIALSAILATSAAAFGAEQSDAAAKRAKPYLLKTCLVSDEKLDGAMGKPYVFIHEGQEIKLCCKSCLKDFKKEPATYVKKLAAAEKGKKTPPPAAPAHNHGSH
jgi:hypothetical protein